MKQKQKQTRKTKRIQMDILLGGLQKCWVDMEVFSRQEKIVA